MPTCVAFGCTNRAGKVPGISFHRFPKKLEQRQAWILACRRKNWLPSNLSCLCSLHFSEDQIDRTSAINHTRLRENAVPNIFPAFPSYLQNTQKPRKPPAKRNSAGVPKESAEEITTLIKEEIVIGNEDTVTSLPAPFPASGESVFENQAAVHLDLEPTDSVPSAIQRHGDTATSLEKDHESRNSNQQLHELEGTVYKCYKIIKEPATSTVGITSSEKKITFSKNGKCVLENGDIVTLVPACFPVPDESVLGDRTNVVLQTTDTAPEVTKSCSDAATSPCGVNEKEVLKQKIEKLEDILDKYRKKIKLLHQQNYRAQLRAIEYKELFEDLKVEQEIKEYSTGNVFELPIEILLMDTARSNTQCLKQQISKVKRMTETHSPIES